MGRFWKGDDIWKKTPPPPFKMAFSLRAAWSCHHIEWLTISKKTGSLSGQKRGQSLELSETLEREGEILKKVRARERDLQTLCLSFAKDTWLTLTRAHVKQNPSSTESSMRSTKVTTYETKFDTIWRNKAEPRLSKS